MKYKLANGEITEDKEVAIKVAEQNADESIRINPPTVMIGFPPFRRTLEEMARRGIKNATGGEVKRITDPEALKKYKEYLVQSFLSNMEVGEDL